MAYPLPPIQNQQLLDHALTHRSYANEAPQEIEDNERLEFLGDAVLGFAIAALLFKHYPQTSEAQLTRLRATLVDEAQLANFARQLGLGSKMKLGRGTLKDGGQDKPSLLSDTFEAVIAAYFLDTGIDAVRDYLEPLFLPVAQTLMNQGTEAAPVNLVDAKNRFQQWSLACFGKNPDYTIVAESGPDHAKEFTAEVYVEGKHYGTGKGHRKQEAEKQAALAALEKVLQDSDPIP
jgi:ribonuclease-3